MPFPKLALLATGASLLVVAPAGAPQWVTRESFTMGTTLQVAVRAADQAQGFAAIESAFLQVRQVDQLLNDWRSDSELSRLNGAPPGAPIRVSRPLMEMLQEISSWTRETGGAFDPAIGVLDDAWDTRGAGRRPSTDSLVLALARVGLLRYHLQPRDLRVTTPVKGSWIDAGGFGKGMALRAARKALLQSGAAAGVLDFGGQVLVFGDTVWTLGVAHPAHRQVSVAELRIHDASASTTSQSERYIEVNGDRPGHVFDPRTGLPMPAWGSVTVVDSDPMIADILSTALFVMGPETGMAWAEEHHVAALFLVDGQFPLAARWSPSMQPYLNITFLQQTGD